MGVGVGMGSNKKDVYHKLQIQSDVRTARPALLRTVTENSLLKKPISRNQSRNQSEKIRRFIDVKEGDGDESEEKEDEGGRDSFRDKYAIIGDNSMMEERAKGDISTTHTRRVKEKGGSSYKECKEVGKDENENDDDARTV